jgi:hypothetical protein
VPLKEILLDGFIGTFEGVAFLLSCTSESVRVQEILL